MLEPPWTEKILFLTESVTNFKFSSIIVFESATHYLRAKKIGLCCKIGLRCAGIACKEGGSYYSQQFFTTSVNFALAKITNDFVFLSPIIILSSF